MLLSKPEGVVQAPLAVVQITASKDCKTVPEGTVNVRVYVVVALATEVPRVRVRPVITAALTMLEKLSNKSDINKLKAKHKALNLSQKRFFIISLMLDNICLG